MKPLHIVAIIEAYTITGPAKNLLEFARLASSEANRGQVELTIFTFTRGARSNLFTETVRRQNTPLEVIEEQDLSYRQVLTQLRDRVARCNPGVVQTHAVKSHFLARCAGLHRQAPWVAFHHGYTWPTWKARAYNQLDRWSLRGARRVVTVSAPFRDELTGFGVPADRIHIVHNAIRPEWAQAARQPLPAAALRRQLGIDPGSNVILIVGRLSREKDHLSLLEAVRQLPAAHRAHLLLVGDGPERGAIEQWIAQNNMSGSVTLAGQQPTAEPFYGIAQVAVLSSLTEGSPNALLETMAAGVPAVATRVGGIPEIAEHGQTALLVEPGRSAPLRDALHALLSDPALGQRLASRAQTQIQQHHNPQTRFETLAALYRSLESRR